MILPLVGGCDRNRRKLLRLASVAFLVLLGPHEPRQEYSAPWCVLRLISRLRGLFDLHLQHCHRPACGSFPVSDSLLDLLELSRVLLAWYHYFQAFAFFRVSYLPSQSAGLLHSLPCRRPHRTSAWLVSHSRCRQDRQVSVPSNQYQPYSRALDFPKAGR